MEVSLFELSLIQTASVLKKAHFLSKYTMLDNGWYADGTSACYAHQQ